jgi:methionyl-tRNA formyltransferase
VPEFRVASLRLAFAGTPDFAARHLAALLGSPHDVVAVLTQPDRPAGRGKQARASAVKALALENGLLPAQPATLRDGDTLEQLARLDLDALIVVAYGLILPQKVLDLPRFGCINVHGSLLPRWRGAAPIQRAIEAGDDETGITIMQMDAGLDTGPMLAHRACAIAPLATSTDLYEGLARIGPQLLLEVLDDLPGHIAGAEEQDDTLATYAAKIAKEEARLDWREPAAVLARRIRAFNPAPGAFTFLGDDRIKVWEALPAPGGSSAPGTIIAADERGVVVGCGEGALRLTVVQLPGARALNAAELLRGHGGRFVPGMSFSVHA